MSSSVHALKHCVDPALKIEQEVPPRDVWFRNRRHKIKKGKHHVVSGAIGLLHHCTTKKDSLAGVERGPIIVIAIVKDQMVLANVPVRELCECGVKLLDTECADVCLTRGFVRC